MAGQALAENNRPLSRQMPTRSQHPSVADLCKSFEDLSKPPCPVTQTSRRSKRPSETPFICTARRSEGLFRPSASTYREKTASATSFSINTSTKASSAPVPLGVQPSQRAAQLDGSGFDGTSQFAHNYTHDGETAAAKLLSPIRQTSRVSDLRRRFERCSPPSSSPKVMRALWQCRRRNKPSRAADRNCVKTSDSLGRSTTAGAHNMGSFGMSSVPRLNMNISLSDFSCDFNRTVDDTEAAGARKQPEEVGDGGELTKQKSPVRGLIQQFEHLGVSSTTGLCLGKRDEGKDSHVHEALTEKSSVENVKRRASWVMLRQRSIVMWRRISNPFTRPSYGGSDGNVDRDKPNSSVSDNASVAELCPKRSRQQYRRSDVPSCDSHHGLARSSPDVQLPSERNTNVKHELAVKPKDQPQYLTRSPSLSRCASPNVTDPSLLHPPYDRLRPSNELVSFDLDGSELSKGRKHRDTSLDGQSRDSPDPPPSWAASQNSHEALPPVGSMEKMAERRRRRLEKKRFDQEEKEKKKEKKAKGKGKEKDTLPSEIKGQGIGGDTQGGGKETEVATEKEKESSLGRMAGSGFVVRQVNGVSLRHPKPRRPGQVQKIINMFKEKTRSGSKLTSGSGIGSASGGGSGYAAAVNEGAK
ncbi:hypothetical protein GGS23DRAFT_213037 [Durotheca rogersii]|uniref:uncharacterized protein n=1 Tax=Durotheca rogersii TaxID=419775 RepID=UPI0022212732|nr:uncharacterized protein GGS23DRAFT_213037 [Durotheca rogersii]KAI5860840.1 hypothetical protein GGS23DRAFT_213037 [Durotheca rogersii]